MNTLDFRVRPPLPSFVNLSIYASHTEDRLLADQTTLIGLHRNRDESKSAREHSMELFFEEFEAAGLTRGVVIGRSAGSRFGTTSNDEIAQFCTENSDQFDGFGGIDGSDAPRAVAEIRRLRSLGLLGAAFDNGWVGLHQDDDRLWEVYDAVASEGLILALTANSWMGADSFWSHPDRVRVVANRYPETPIVVTHASWAWTVQACALAYLCPNVYLLPDCYLNTFAPGYSDYVTAANGFMLKRLLYGSAYPVRPLGTSINAFETLDLTAAAKQAARWDNGMNLLDSVR